jgi:carbon monoxide dehydrogenase subunit G
MQFEESFVVRAPVDQVWMLLNDIPRVSQCIPGVQDILEVGPDTYRGLIKVNVGLVGSTFQGEVKVLERKPPRRLAARIRGDGRSSANDIGASFSAELEPIAEGTYVTCRVDYTLRSRLGRFGSSLLQGTIKKMAAEFAWCLEKALTPGL